MVAAAGLSDALIEELRTSVRGPVLRPGEDGYEIARKVWNGMIDKRPGLIVRCTGVADVISAVKFGRTHDLLVAVRGGGHNVGGKSLCDDGLLIDLSLMKGIVVDAANRTARAQAGVLWGEFDRETQAFGLATAGGVVSTTGIAGLTLGGGFGWLMRKYGLTCDNLLSVNLVTAEGEAITASEGENADLFWGLRGGSGNFGIATSFEYRLHSVGPIVVGGMVLHPLAQAADALRFYREFTQTAPDELTTYAGLLHSPDGAAVVALRVCYARPVEQGERVVQPLKNFSTPVADLFGSMSYLAQQQMFDAGFPAGNQYYEKSSFLAEISDDAIGTLISHFERVPSPLSGALIEHHGGAIRRVAEDATAFAHRAPEYNLVIPSAWIDPAESETEIAWTRGLWEAMQPFSTGGVYVNYMAEGESEERVRAAYGTNYGRLAALKRRWDPTNFFCLNQNILPSEL